MSNYRSISSLGPNVTQNDPTSNPLSYCLLDTLDSGFNHGGIGRTISGKYSKNCQNFMSQYCASNWDGVCEFASGDLNVSYPNTLQTCGNASDIVCKNMNAGEVLIANTAARKYLVQMGGTCTMKSEPFDPTVAGSPMITYWDGTCNSQGNGGCTPVYAVDPKTIDNDPVMNKILAKPIIAWNVLVNIYNTAIRTGSLNNLSGTKIYNFFNSQSFQNYMKNKNVFESNYVYSPQYV